MVRGIIPETVSILTNYLQSQQPRTGEFWSVDLHEAPQGWFGFAAHGLGPHLGNVKFRA